MSSEIVVGLDIGTTKIACLVGRKTENNKIEILGIGKSESIGVTRGVVSNIEKTVASIRTAVEEAERESGVNIRLVNVGIAGQHIKSLQHRGIRTRRSMDEEITRADIDALVEDMYKLVMLPGEEIIHALPQEFTVDSETGIKDPVGMCGVRLEANFHIITGQITAIKNIYKCVTKAGLTVDALTLEPLASAAAVLSEEEKEAGVVLVDIGGGTTDIAIFQDGIIRHTAVIPFGGNIITEDIKQGCTIMRNQAELLKVKFGSALATENKDNEIVCIPGLKGRDAKEISLRNLAHIIEARMEEIIEHVHYEIRNSGYEKQLIGGIVLTGGGSQLKHMKQLVEYITGMDCRIGYPNEHVSKSVDDNLLIPAMSTGVGLVINGLEKYSVSMQSETVNAETPQDKKASSPLREKHRDNRGPASFLNRIKEFFDAEEE
ncbi:MAG: cell division protein FtsA [Flavobacteriales bacterium]|nr:cell division protein FtsA [Flavobacteriales bacterium]